MQDDLIHKVRFGIPLPEGSTTTDKSSKMTPSSAEDKVDTVGRSGRIGAAFVGMIEVIKSSSSSLEGGILEAASRAAAETAAPLFITTQDIWGKEAYDEAYVLMIVDQVLGYGVAPDRLVLCRLPCCPQLESAYTRLMEKVKYVCIYISGYRSGHQSVGSGLYSFLLASTVFCYVYVCRALSCHSASRAMCFILVGNINTQMMKKEQD